MDDTGVTPTGGSRGSKKFSAVPLYGIRVDVSRWGAGRRHGLRRVIARRKRSWSSILLARGTSLAAKASGGRSSTGGIEAGRVSPQRPAIVQLRSCDYPRMALKMVTMIGVVGAGDRELEWATRAWEIV